MIVDCVCGIKYTQQQIFEPLSPSSLAMRAISPSSAFWRTREWEDLEYFILKYSTIDKIQKIRTPAIEPYCMAECTGTPNIWDSCVGWCVGLWLGSLDGIEVGFDDGCEVGWLVGWPVGMLVGWLLGDVGWLVGRLLGWADLSWNDMHIWVGVWLVK